MFKKKCFICGYKDKKRNMARYESYDPSADSYHCYYYHKDCLKNASCNAKSYSNYILILIDEVVDDIKQQKEYRMELLDKCDKICKKLKGE